MKKILLTFLFIFLFAVRAHAATVSIVVGQQSVAAGESFVAEWYLNTDGASFNVVRGVLDYTPDTLELQSVSTGSSALVLWPQTPTQTKPGVIAFTGGVPGGVSGNHVLLLRTTFKATKAGNAALFLGTPSELLLADGLGTAVPLTMSPVSFLVIPEQGSDGRGTETITSPTHPDQDKWYRKDEALITVHTKTVENYVYSFGSNPEIIPSTPLTSNSQTFSFDGLADGIYYFKLGLLNEQGAQEVGTYRVLVDTTAPEFLSTLIEKDQTVFDEKPFATFYATDKGSGVARYQIRTGWFGTYSDATSPTRIHRPVFGNVMHIKAIDGAHNEKISRVYYRGYLPNMLSAILLVLLGGTLVRIIYRVCKKF